MRAVHQHSGKISRERIYQTGYDHYEIVVKNHAGYHVHETNLVCKKKIISFLAGPMERNYYYYYYYFIYFFFSPLYVYSFFHIIMFTQS